MECRGSSIVSHYFDLADRDLLLEELRKSGTVSNRELHVRRKDGRALWILANDVLLPETQDPPLIQATVIDISARKEAEEALRASEAHFRILVEQALDGIFIADGLGKYLDVNSAGAAMLGYTREEILRRSIADVVHRRRGGGGGTSAHCGGVGTPSRKHDDPERMEIPACRRIGFFRRGRGQTVARWAFAGNTSRHHRAEASRRNPAAE